VNLEVRITYARSRPVIGGGRLKRVDLVEVSVTGTGILNARLDQRRRIESRGTCCMRLAEMNGTDLFGRSGKANSSLGRTAQALFRLKQQLLTSAD
jgi:hypothetical protein